jgi:hypothetical protein
LVREHEATCVGSAFLRRGCAMSRNRGSPLPPDQIAAPPAVLPLRAVAANRLTNAALVPLDALTRPPHLVRSAIWSVN